MLRRLFSGSQVYFKTPHLHYVFTAWRVQVRTAGGAGKSARRRVFHLVKSNGRPIVFHPKATDAVRQFPREARVCLGKDLFRLHYGGADRKPVSRPMPVVSAGAPEVRVKGVDGIFRVFHYLASAKGVLVFHAFV
jgi:phage-related protein